MSSQTFKTLHFLCLFFFVVTFSLSVLQWNWIFVRENILGYKPRYDHEEYLAFIKTLEEKFDTTYTRYSSTETILQYLDSSAQAQNITPEQSREYVDILDDFLQMRFRHAIYHYEFEDNYVLYFLGKYVWSHLSVIVIPNDILKNKNQIAFCSQQATVFMDVIQKRGFKTRKVGLKGHFCFEVFYDDAWHFYDTNLEAKFDDTKPRPSAEDLKANQVLRQKAYETSPHVTANQVDGFFDLASIEYGEVNAFPAKNVRILHYITYYFSHFAWVFFLLLYLLGLYLTKSNRQVIPQ